MRLAKAVVIALVAGLAGCARVLEASVAAPAQLPAQTLPGDYAIDPDHTQVLFRVSHMGFSNYYGEFSGVSGTLHYTPAAPGEMRVTVRVPVDSVATTSSKLNVDLQGPVWLDSKRYPTMIFESRAVLRAGAAEAAIEGVLTLHGISRPITLRAWLVGAGTNPLTRRDTVGFQIEGTLRRSDFGVGHLVPVVGDEVSLVIAAAFER